MTSKEKPVSLEILTRNDAISLLELIQESLYCETLEGYKTLISKLGKLIPFDYAISGLARVEGGKLKSYNIINLNYPEEWLDVYEKKGYPFVDPIVLENFSAFKLQFWKDTYRKYRPPKEFIKDADDFNLRAGYSNGVVNRNGRLGSIFTISGHYPRRDELIETVLSILTPHLHNVMAKINTASQNTQSNISEREKEVLNWLKEGKSSWDIAMILNISENTVNFHIKNIMEKLNAVKRTQAVASAIDNGLIEL